MLGIDSSPDMLAQAGHCNRRAIAEGRVQLHLGRFDALPWPSGSIGKILAVNVVYFFSEGGDEIREARRVLAPGGLMAVYATHKDTMQHWKFAGPIRTGSMARRTCARSCCAADLSRRR